MKLTSVNLDRTINECRPDVSTFCIICNKTFISAASYQRHMQRSHGPDKIHDCVLCNESFNEVQQLLDHIKDHEVNKSESYYQCPFCEKLFSRNSLESHVETHIGSDLISANKKLKDCFECGETFNQLNQLSSHRRREHQKKYECELCSQKFARTEDLHMHLKMHKGKTVLTCLCEKMFATTIHLAQHLRKIHSNQVNANLILFLEEDTSVDKSKGISEWNAYSETFSRSTAEVHASSKNDEFKETERKYPCPVNGCYLNFQKFLTLVVHCRRNHKNHVSEIELRSMKLEWEKIQFSKCPLCQKCTISQENLLEHLKVDHGANRPFNCFKCKIRFSKVQTLEDHVNCIHKDQQFKCNYCGTVFQKQSSLSQHYKKHEGTSIFKCDTCGIPYTDLRSLGRHQRVHYTDGKPHKCDICSRQFAQSSDKIKHLRTHTETRPYKCETCEKKFAHITSWKRHKAVHTKIRDFVCQHCGKGFQHRSNLIVHLRSHTGERPFHCKQCPKTFLTSGHYSDHVKIHLGIKNFKCETCQKEFLHQSSYLKHKKAVHLGIKQFKCKICQREFTQRGHFREHLLVHSDEKRFICGICTKTFRRSDALKSHMSKHEFHSKGQKKNDDGPQILNDLCQQHNINIL